MPQVVKPKANTGKTLSVYKQLKKQHSLRAVQRKCKPLLSKPLQNKQLISQFLAYYKYALKFAWHNQPWYQGTGLHYSKSCSIRPFSQQVCGGGYKNPDYENTMLFDTPINHRLLKDIEFFPLVRSKITRMLGREEGGTANENLLWHKDESPCEVLRIVVPLEYSGEYKFQIDNYEPITLEPGMVYAFDQSILHRIFKTHQTPNNRTHLILSYVTWFNKTTNGWQPNEYAGEVHPLDLFDEINL